MKRKHNTVIVNKLLLVCIGLSFLAAIIKVCMVAFSKEVDGLDLKEFADSRNTVKEVIRAGRGGIYDVNGDALAQSVNSYTVFAYLSDTRTKDEDNPQHVKDKTMTASKLAPILNMEEDYLFNLLSTKGLYQIDLKRGISELVKEEIEALDLPGIDFLETNKRWYQMGDFASYIIGYATTDENDEITGQMGIESLYNDVLNGKDGYMEYQKDAYGYRMPQSKPIVVDAEPGNDIYLTIDSNIQMYVENGIQSIVNKYDLQWMTFTVMDAKTGAIVASASSPSFNLNTRDGIESYLNPLVSYQYEPGSTMKIFSFMSAMENGKYDGSATYQSGSINIDGYRIADFNGRGWGTITYDEGFAYSSNTAATYLALSLGRDNLKNTYDSLGFGKKTGIELPGEGTGNINFYYKTELATAAFGQGITTTPIQNLQALSALTNNGTTIKPHIVDRIVDSKGNVIYQAEREELNKVASKETTEKLRSLMYDVVYSGKTDAGFFKADNITLIGKTGTAQIAGDTGYLSGKYDYIKSFAGIFPYEDPEYIIYISVKQLVGPFSDVAKMVKQVVEEVAKYKNITETVEEVDNSKIIKLDNYISSDVLEIEDKLKKLKLDPIVIGKGKYIVNQYPLKNVTLVSGSKVFLLTNDTTYEMPDMSNWSSNDAITFCNIVGLKYKINGYGKVIGTSIEKGSEISANQNIEITLSSVKPVEEEPKDVEEPKKEE